MNVAYLIHEQAIVLGDKTAIRHANEKITFKELEIRINAFAMEFIKYGIKPGDKVLVFVKPGIDFPALVFALFKLKAIAVLMDPGMGVSNLLRSIKQLAPDYLIGIPAVTFLANFFPGSFKSVKRKITYNKRWVGYVLERPKIPLPKHDTNAEDTAAILFTSGGTGAPKGVVYPHRIFIQQTKLLKKMFNLGPNDVDFAGFPLFALFTLAMGMTVIVPRMDASKPAKCDPKKLVDDILKYRATFLAGSPAIWERVAKYCEENLIKLPSVRKLVMFGAPVDVVLHKRYRSILGRGETYAPYGATECLPVALFSGSDVIPLETKINAGEGMCVGLPAPYVEIKIIPITDNVIGESELTFLPEGEVGEILVHASTVTPSYYQLPSQTAKAKVWHQGKLWHRMGDVGHLDKLGRLWFCGRKSHIVKDERNQLIFSVPCESIFNNHPEIKQTALVQLNKDGQTTCGLVVQRFDGRIKLRPEKQELFFKQLEELSKRKKDLPKIEAIFLRKTFPVDGRHNIKIDRLKLSSWAQERIK